MLTVHKMGGQNRPQPDARNRAWLNGPATRI